jgi:YidC/Oxa1 family membrane protein insertase
MTNERRTLIALFLSGLILLGWSLYMSKYGPKPVPKPQPSPLPSNAPADTTTRPPTPLTPVAPPTATPDQEKKITVETDRFRAVFSTRGASLESYRLKGYKGLEEGGVELVPKGQKALSFLIPLSKDTLDLSGVIFRCEVDSIRLGAGGPPAEAVFIASLSESLSLEEKLRFSSGEFGFGVEVLVRAPHDAPLGRDCIADWRTALASTEKNKKEDQRYFGAVALLGTAVHTEHEGGLKKGPQTFTGEIGWAGMRTKYFLACLIPEGGGTSFEARRTPDGQATTRLAVSWKESRNVRYRAFLGPLSYGVLKLYGRSLELLTESGWSWTHPLLRFFLKVLLALHRVIPNYGLVIIVFTVLVEIVLFPLTLQSLKSAKKMQKLQPRMNQIREQYKKDPARMNKETMALYQKYKVNPFGGCLPMLIQAPVFITLYSLFKDTFELRGAAFAFWLTDLSQPDRFYVLPILMGVSQFFQSKLSGMANDPRQKQMTYMMPVMMTVMFIFYNFPSGLTLYWFVKNLLSIAENYFVHIQAEREEALAEDK